MGGICGGLQPAQQRDPCFDRLPAPLTDAELIEMTEWVFNIIGAPAVRARIGLAESFVSQGFFVLSIGQLLQVLFRPVICHEDRPGMCAVKAVECLREWTYEKNADQRNSAGRVARRAG